jgi:ferric-dicitrate binding protein FerR (iron transport regulator)
MSSHRQRRHAIRREHSFHPGHAAAIERTLRILDQLATATRTREESPRNHPGIRRAGE